MSVSQTGRVNDNTLRITEDHKLVVLQQRDPRSRCAMCSPSGTACSWSTMSRRSRRRLASRLRGRRLPGRTGYTALRRPTAPSRSFRSRTRTGASPPWNARVPGRVRRPVAQRRQPRRTPRWAAARSEAPSQSQAPSKTASASAGLQRQRAAWRYPDLASWALSLDATVLRRDFAGYVDGNDKRTPKDEQLPYQSSDRAST